MIPRDTIPRELKPTDCEVMANFGYKKSIPKYAKAQAYKRGLCIICNGEDKCLKTYKIQICKRCYVYIKEYMGIKYGGICKNKMTEAVAFVKKPIDCRFKAICGHTMPPFVNGVRSSSICNDCKIIWNAGYKAASNKRNLAKKVNLKTVHGDFR